jgi:carboxylesterase
MEKLADAFHERGYTVYAPLLPGHGTRVEDLARTPWESWEREALSAYRALQRGHERVAVAGLSMGGALALRIAEQEKPAAVVAVNAPVWLREPGATLAWLVKHWKEETIKPVEDNNGHYYDRIPLAAIDQLMELVSTTHRGLPRVSSPVLIIQSREDETILPESARAIYLGLRSEKELAWREGGGHVITREPDVVRKVFEYVTAR